jgi:hypothetical protein
MGKEGKAMTMEDLERLREEAGEGRGLRRSLRRHHSPRTYVLHYQLVGKDLAVRGISIDAER